jgi:hypothetical protein
MQPKAIRTDLVVRQDEVEITLFENGEDVAQIDAVTYAVWQLADGRRDADAISGLLARRFPAQLIDEETVWSAFDVLRAYELIENWNTAPADAGRVTRRQAFRSFARTAAYVASVTPIASAAFAQSKPGGNQAEAAAKKQQEAAVKRNQTEAASKKQQEATQKKAQEQATKQAAGNKPKPKPGALPNQNAQQVEQAAKKLQVKPKPKP